MISFSVGKKNPQEGTKTQYAATCTQSWYCCHAFWRLKHTCSVLGMAAAQIWLNGSAQCWHTLGFTLPLLIVLSHAGTMLARFLNAE